MKKMAPYCIASLIFLVIAIILSLVFRFSLSNTWQGLVSLPFIFGPLWIWGWKQTCVHKTKHAILSFFGKYCLILFAVGYVATAIIYLAGLI